MTQQEWNRRAKEANKLLKKERDEVFEQMYKELEEDVRHKYPKK